MHKKITNSDAFSYFLLLSITIYYKFIELYSDQQESQWE